LARCKNRLEKFSYKKDFAKDMAKNFMIFTTKGRRFFMIRMVLYRFGGETEEGADDGGRLSLQ